MVDRILLISSILLVVLTVIFTQFMSAEKFWQGQVVQLEVKLLEQGLDQEFRKRIEDKYKQFDEIHHKQKLYGRIFATLMSCLLIVTAVCFPIGRWNRSAAAIKFFTVILICGLCLLASIGLFFAFGLWSP